MTDKEIFKEACLTGVSVESVCDREGLDPQHKRLLALKCGPSKMCHVCKIPVADANFDIFSSYWHQSWFPAHATCREPGMKIAAFHQQIVDADCNDCKHFARSKGRDGTCKKFNRPAEANPNFCSAWPCFEHRKDEATIDELERKVLEDTAGRHGGK